MRKRRGGGGKRWLAVGTAARWLQAAVLLRAAAPAPLSPLLPRALAEERGLGNHGQGGLGSWPQGRHEGAGEARGKPAASSEGAQASATGTTSAAALRSGGEGVPPVGVRVCRAEGQAREMVRAQPRLRHRCLLASRAMRM